MFECGVDVSSLARLYFKHKSPLYTNLPHVLGVTICHDQLVSGISNNEEFYTLACITGVIMRVLRRLLCDLSLEILSGHLKRCTHLIGFALLL